MAYPIDPVVVGDLITVAQINRWPVLLADELLVGSDADFDFTSIPAHWTYLKVVVYARSDEAGATVATLKIRFNGDTAANYDSQDMYSSAAAPSSAESLGLAYGVAGLHPRAGAGANLFSTTEIVIPHYAGTANNKAAVCLSSSKVGIASGNLSTRHSGVFWRSNSAITRVTILPEAGNFVAGSRASLYGMGRI